MTHSHGYLICAASELESRVEELEAEVGHLNITLEMKDSELSDFKSNGTTHKLQLSELELKLAAQKDINKDLELKFEQMVDEMNGTPFVVVTNVSLCACC